MANKSSKLEIQVDADTRSAIKDLDRVSDSVDDISAAAADAGSALDSIASGAAGAAEAAGDSFGGIVPVFDVAAVLGAVGSLATKAGEVFSEKLTQGMEFEAGIDKLQVQLNLTADQAAKAGKLAGDIYAEAWGDSISDVNEGIQSVIRNIGLTTESPNLKAITTQVLALADAFDVDLNTATSAAGVLMKTGLAANAEEALDIITRGLQTSSGEADDFLEAITESSANLKTFGFTGKQAIGLINQGMKAGAENADAITGLFEELVGNVASGGDELSEVFDSLGIDSKKVIDQLAAGGPDAAAGIDTLIDAIRNVEDPLKRSAAIAALFGEEGAALQQVLLSLDPSNAVDALGDVAGAAQNATDALGDNAQGKLESFKRSMEVNVTQFIADNVIPGLTVLGGHAQRIFGEMGTAWDAFVQGFRGEKPLELQVSDGKLLSSISAVEGAAATEPPILTTIREIGVEVRALSDEWLPKLEQAWKDLQGALQSVSDFMRENKEVMEILKAVAIAGLIAALLLLVGTIFVTAAAFGAMALGMLVILAPIATIIGVLRYFGVTWDEIWRGAEIVITTVGGQIGDAIGTIIETVENLIGLVVDLFSAGGDWDSAWKAAGRIVETIAGFVERTVGRMAEAIQNLIDLFSGAPGIGSGNIPAGNIPRSVMPAIGPTAFAATAVRPAPVFNVTIAHSGLAVDSPRLQREIVDALRRWQKREGPLRGMMGN